MAVEDVAPPLPSSGEYKGFWSFGLMITPVLINVIYIVGMVFITLSGVLSMFMIGSQSVAIGVIAGLISIVMGNVLWRVWCELMIVIFRIFGTLKEIEGHVRPK